VIALVKGNMKHTLFILFLTLSTIEAQPITISFVGDMTLGSSLYNKSFDIYYREKGPEYFLSGVDSIFKSTDLAVGNLEGVISDIGKPNPKKFNFRGKPSYLDILKYGGINVVSTANNHVYDYGDIGFENTLKNLDSSGIDNYGFNKVITKIIRGKKISFIADNGFRYNDTLMGRVQELKKNSDFVVVSMHWGTESSYKPNALQIRIGRNLIDSGADLVIGHHPHVLQPVECYKGKYIAYSLGNFCFGGNSNPREKRSMILICTLSDTIEIKKIPIMISSTDTTNDFHPVIINN